MNLWKTEYETAGKASCCRWSVDCAEKYHMADGGWKSGAGLPPKLGKQRHGTWKLACLQLANPGNGRGSGVDCPASCKGPHKVLLGMVKWVSFLPKDKEPLSQHKNVIFFLFILFSFFLIKRSWSYRHRDRSLNDVMAATQLNWVLLINQGRVSGKSLY